MLTKPLIIAHRGASGYEPENTIGAFKHALELHADGIELDVYVCKTGELVVIHDETVDRTTNGTGAVAQLSYHDLQQLNAGRGERIPLLSQVFDLINNTILINIELKGPGTALKTAQLIRSYKDLHSIDNNKILVTSFDINLLKEFRAIEPEIQTGVIFDSPLDYSLPLIETDSTYAIIDHVYITEKIITQLHNEKYKVFAYTVNDQTIAYYLMAIGIDGIITDYPDILSRGKPS